ncbi:hypothetical protein Acsp03_32260 [Actinomadura sp. NBRC 104412]|uniref:DUF4192 domain-containing protein n=1 Tax=Actinomadura sp. NBRC 104412 TaxID=3032203 RepID=UPI0024A5F120|nr:DUF4192 family protein [Actinomadura sp. NBRC 104412]GLZ05760.1 hypothetical protein Acsp03_32260 [Actinomadura sp. NBRC 104412]
MNELPPGRTPMVIRNIADAIAAIPYLFGFHPVESLVVIGYDGPHNTCAIRIDLPSEDPHEPAERVAAMLADNHFRQSLIVGYGPKDRVDRAAATTGARLLHHGMAVTDAARVTDGHWWSLTAPDADGRPCDISTSVVAAQATYSGHVALADRSELRRTVAPQTGPPHTTMQQATQKIEDHLKTWKETLPTSQYRHHLIHKGLTLLATLLNYPPQTHTTEPTQEHPTNTTTASPPSARAIDAAAQVVPVDRHPVDAAGAALEGAAEPNDSAEAHSQEIAKSGGKRPATATTAGPAGAPSVRAGDAAAQVVPVDRHPVDAAGAALEGAAEPNESAEAHSQEIAKSGGKRPATATTASPPDASPQRAAGAVGRASETSERPAGAPVPGADLTAEAEPTAPRVPRDAGSAVTAGFANPAKAVKRAGECAAWGEERPAQVAGERAPEAPGLTDAAPLSGERRKASSGYDQARQPGSAGAGRRRTPRDEEVAWLGFALRELRVRDEAWVRINEDDPTEDIRFWRDILRRVDERFTDAPACLLAYAAYVGGDGSLANVALDRASPDYSMAALLRSVIDAGVPPSEVRLRMSPEELADIYAEEERE